MIFTIPLLGVLIASALALDDSPVREYISADGSFRLSVPAGYGVHTDNDKPSRSYIPVCHDDSVVCIARRFPTYRAKHRCRDREAGSAVAPFINE